MLNHRKKPTSTGFLNRIAQSMGGGFRVRKKRKKKKKIRVRQRKTIFTALSTRIIRGQKAIFAVTALLLLLTLSVIGVRKTIFAKRYTFTNVAISKESQAAYYNEALFTAIQEAYIGKNYFLTRWGGNQTITETIKKQFPLVNTLNVSLPSDSSAMIDVAYNDPMIIFLLPGERRFATYDESIYQLGTGDFLGTDSPLIQLPRYTEPFENIDGIFFKISEKKLHDSYTTILNTLGPETINEIIYLPGGQKFFVGYKSKRLYIHINKDVNVQLGKLVDLENYYNGFEHVSVIDLGSLDDSIVK